MKSIAKCLLFKLSFLCTQIKYGFIVFSFFIISCSDSDDNSRCQLEPDSGICQAAIPKFYFDQEEQKCKEFFWGGCGGVVPFDTLEECRECE